MHEKNFWTDLTGLSGTTLKTLGYGNAFDVVSADAKNVVIRPHESMTERTIARQAFEGAFGAIRASGSLDLKGIRKFNEMNPVYIAAMIARLPYIRCVPKPRIVLHYAVPTPEKPVQP